MNLKKIKNPDNVPIQVNEKYPYIFEYSIPNDYYFENDGVNYGNVILTARELNERYEIKKRDGVIQ